MTDFKPNTFQMPIVLVDEWLPQLTGREWIVLCVVARYTMTNDHVALPQIYKLCKWQTGGTNNINDAIDRLLKKRLIRKLPSGDIPWYALNDLDEEQAP